MTAGMTIHDEGESISMSDMPTRILERYGFTTLLSAAILWFARTDIVVPMVAAHLEFLKTLTKTQEEIGKTVHDQTEIMKQIQKDAIEWRRTVGESVGK